MRKTRSSRLEEVIKESIDRRGNMRNSQRVVSRILEAIVVRLQNRMVLHSPECGSFREYSDQ